MKELYKEITKLSCDIMDITYIVSDYCARHADNEETARICPVIKLLYNTADMLYLKVYEFEDEFINKNAP